MRTGKAARYYSEDDIRIEEHPIPDLKRGEILVKTKACSVCSLSHLLAWTHTSPIPIYPLL